MKRHLQHFGWTMGVALALTGLAASAQAQVSYHVDVDTSAISGELGFVDLQLNPGGTDALPATGLVSGFTGGVLAPTSTSTGDASGTLPGPVILHNTAALNELLQGITFGPSLSLDGSFAGPALSPTAPLPSSGTTFALSLYDATGLTPLLTSDSGGAILHIEINADGSTDTETFLTDSGGGPVATATIISPPTVVPEPGTAGVFAMAVMPLLSLSRRRQRR